MEKGLFDKAGDFIKKIDPSSWPVFFMFLVVLSAAGGLNYITMTPIVGSVVAVLIAAFFGVGVLSWHITESRTDDSKYQEDTAKVVKWGNAGLDGVLIVINLFRAEFQGSYDWIAYLIIGLSAASHVVGYLLWTENAPSKLAKKELARGMSDLARKGQRADIAIQTTEEHMRKLKWIHNESLRLRKEYAGVPGINVESMIKSMTDKALAEFKDIKKEDVQNQHQPKNAPVVANASDTSRVELAEPKDKDFTQAGRQ